MSIFQAQAKHIPKIGTEREDIVRYAEYAGRFYHKLEARYGSILVFGTLVSMFALAASTLIHTTAMVIVGAFALGTGILCVRLVTDYRLAIINRQQYLRIKIDSLNQAHTRDKLFGRVVDCDTKSNFQYDRHWTLKIETWNDMISAYALDEKPYPVPAWRSALRMKGV